MIVNVVEIFTEYLSVILCEHKIAKKKVAFDRYFWMFFLLNLFSILLAYRYLNEHGWLMLLVYVNFYIYVKLRLADNWLDSLKIFGKMFILIPCLQLISFYCIKIILFILGISQEKYVIGILANCVICMTIIMWKKQYILIPAKIIGNSKGIFLASIYGIFTVYILFFFKKSDYVYEPMIVQLLVMIVGIGIIFVLWVNAENEKRIKEKELQLYEAYNKTFEEAITAIRLRQHEFDNHINAIKCLQFTIDNPNDLLKAQNDYCDKILQENSFNKLLKLRAEPILVGFLYSKFMSAKEQGIDIYHEIQVIEVNNKIKMTELIEIIGILFDNAVEAVSERENTEKKLIIKILQEDTQKITIEIANISRKYLNSEIEKFCVRGYSTKGEKRGIGLSRVKDIIKMYKADFYIENVSYNDENYLSFKIRLL